MEEIENKSNLFQDLTNTNNCNSTKVIDDNEEIHQPTEVESLCVNCGENGVTTLLLAKIPHYREVILSSFHCEICGFRNNNIQSGGAIQDQGIQYKVFKINLMLILLRQFRSNITFANSKMNFGIN